MEDKIEFNENYLQTLDRKLIAKRNEIDVLKAIEKKLEAEFVSMQNSYFSAKKVMNESKGS